MAKTILEEAQELVYGDRQSDYGHPRDNFAATAALIQGYLIARYTGRVDHGALTPGDAAVIMLLVKVARYATGKPKRDTIVDMAGYVEVLARVEGLDE